MMRKLLFTAHWSAEEAETIMMFLDELKEMIATNYEAELSEMYQRDMMLHDQVEQPLADHEDEEPF